MKRVPTDSTSQPWSAAIALITGSLTVLVGVARGMEPHVIACRSFWAAGIVYLTVRICISASRVLSAEE